MHFEIFTPSFNKLEMVRECIDSVMNQTYTDFTYWIGENSTDSYTKLLVGTIVSQYKDSRIMLVDEHIKRPQPIYFSSWLMNRYLPYMNGTIIWLSDDDLLKPNCLQRVKQEFERVNEANVVYWSLTTSIWNGTQFVDTDTRKGDKIISMGTNVDCMLDGGQIAYRSSILKDLSKPYWREVMDNDAAHCDGIFMNRIVERNNFHPINEVLSVKRTGPASIFTQR